jgi:tetratricopeptide (TPR) repeat protein
LAAWYFVAVTNLIIGVLGAMMASNQPAALSNLVTQTTGISITAIATNSPVEQELQKIEAEDDDASADVDGWIRDNNKFAAQGAGIPPNELNRRIRDRFEPSQKAYLDFIQRHPDNARARIAYASLLNDLGDEEGEFVQLLKARDLDPSIPSVWNNLGNYYGEHSPTTNAFICYEKAIELDPTESTYYHNFGTTVYLYRTDVKEYYHINEQQTFDKALGLYSNAMRLDPTNFPLASDVAESYYGIKPLRTNDALLAWTNALNLAHDEIEREGVYIHFARIKMSIGRLAEAKAHLDAVTNELYEPLKTRLVRNLAAREATNNLTAPMEAPATPTSPGKTNSATSPP